MHGKRVERACFLLRKSYCYHIFFPETDPGRVSGIQSISFWVQIISFSWGFFGKDRYRSGIFYKLCKIEPHLTNSNRQPDNSWFSVAFLNTCNGFGFLDLINWFAHILAIGQKVISSNADDSVEQAFSVRSRPGFVMTGMWLNLKVPNCCDYVV